MLSRSVHAWLCGKRSGAVILSDGILPADVRRKSWRGDEVQTKVHVPQWKGAERSLGVRG
jgi:hypothetical protein